MATNTTNFGFKKPDESDFYSIGDQNNNWDKVDKELQNLDAPTFEDYTGSTAVPTAAAALEGIKSKGKLATLLSNIKAFAKGCCTLAMIVDNCTTNRSDLPGSAAQLKVLMDLYTQLNSDKLSKSGDAMTGVLWAKDITSNGYGLMSGEYNSLTLSAMIGANKASAEDTRLQLLSGNYTSNIANKIRISDTNSKWYYLFGEHNKPNGSYIGNGDATARTIEIGGIGKVLLVWSLKGFEIVTPIGCTGTKDFNNTETYFEFGVHNLKTDNELLNGDGIEYYYQVL